MREPEQIDLEDAIAAAERAQSEFLAPLKRGAPPPGEPIRAKVPAIPDRSMKELREEEREKLASLAREIEDFIARAKDKNSPLHKELSVRVGQRAVSSIYRKARALAEATLHDPHITHPTREREHQADEAPLKGIVYAGETPVAVNHRWEWPVRQAHRKHILSPEEVLAADRFRRAFQDAHKSIQPTNYGDLVAASDPTKRNGLTPSNIVRQTKGLALAGGEAGYVWVRLEAELRAVAWALILEETFPNHPGPMTLVSFGREVAKSNTDEHARWFAYGQLKLTCVRLHTIFRLFDAERVKLSAEEIEKGRRLIRGERVDSRRAG